MNLAGSSNGRTHGSEPCNLGSNPSPAAVFNNANSKFSGNDVRSPSPATSGAGFAFAAASPPLWRKMKRILILSGEYFFFFQIFGIIKVNSIP